MTHHFKNELRLGDCFWHCMFMRRSAKAHPDRMFTLYCNDAHIPQLEPVVSDLPNIALLSLRNTPADAINCWIGEWWYSHPDHNDIILFLVKWFAYMAEKCGMEPVIAGRSDLLADYPALYEPKLDKACDFLVINSYPQSGQWGYDQKDMDGLINALSRKWQVIVTAPCGNGSVHCTANGNMSITDIGRLSQRCSGIIGCATGPFWPTCNVWNMRPFKERIVFLREQWVDYGENWAHFKTIKDCMEHLRLTGTI